MTAYKRKPDISQGKDIVVDFTPPVRKQFAELAELANSSSLFSREIADTLSEWSRGKNTNLRNILLSFPLIAEEFAAHVEATKDEAAKETMRQLASEMLESGFNVSRLSRRGR